MSLKRIFVILVFMLSLNVASVAQKTFTFGMFKSEIQKNHKLDEIQIDNLNKNIKKFYGDDNFNDITFYVLNDLKKEKICELEFFYFLGFYKDSLFAIFCSTDELSANFELKDEKCINSNFFESDSIQSMSFIRKTSATTGGNIFGEAGTAIQNAYEDRYVVELISTGMSVFSPTHKQYAFITLSKIIIDRLNKNIQIHSDYKKYIKPSFLFTSSIHEEFDKLQEPLKSNEK